MFCKYIYWQLYHLPRLESIPTGEQRPVANYYESPWLDAHLPTDWPILPLTYIFVFQISIFFINRIPTSIQRSGGCPGPPRLHPRILYVLTHIGGVHPLKEFQFKYYVTVLQDECWGGGLGAHIIKGLVPDTRHLHQTSARHSLPIPPLALTEYVS